MPNSYLLGITLLVLLGLFLTVAISCSGPKTPSSTAQRLAANDDEAPEVDSSSEKDEPELKDDDTKPNAAPIDRDTITAYEKLGAAFCGCELKKDTGFVSHTGMKAANYQLPGFVFSSLRESRLSAALPPVSVQFGLDFSRTDLTNEELASIKDLDALIALDICVTKVTDVGLKELKKLKHLTVIDLRYNEITDMGLKELSELKYLSSVDLGYTKVTDTGIRDLKHFRNLSALGLQKTNVTDKGLKELKQFKHLSFLDLMETRITDAGLKELKGLKNLTELRLYGTRVTNAGVEDILKALPKCKITN